MNKKYDPILDMNTDNLHLPVEITPKEQIERAKQRLRLNNLKLRLLKKQEQTGTL